MQQNWGLLFCFGLSGLCVLYMGGGMYASGGTPPNSAFWSSLGGLVKDGFVYSAGGTVEVKGYEAVPRMGEGSAGLPMPFSFAPMPMGELGCSPSPHNSEQNSEPPSPAEEAGQ